LRAAIVSVGISVQRELDAEKPDVEFLIDINDKVAGGLSAIPGPGPAHEGRLAGDAA
jgi:hypothetical protein